MLHRLSCRAGGLMRTDECSRLICCGRLWGHHRRIQTSMSEPTHPKPEEHSMLRLIIAGIAAGSAFAFTTGPSAAQTLDKVKQRGVLVVGTKADYKPFGFRDTSGAIVGFEPDLAKDVAARLGARLQLEPVVSSNRMQFLQQGKIDLMLATMNVTQERRQTVGIIDPSYYASGVNVLAIKKAALKTWEQLKNQKICAIQGAWYNKVVAEKYGAEIVAFRGQNESETALLHGNCIGWIYDDTAFLERLGDPKWSAFEMPLDTIWTSRGAPLSSLRSATGRGASSYQRLSLIGTVRVS